MDELVHSMHLSRETLAGQGRPPWTLVVIGTGWPSTKAVVLAHRARDTPLSSYQ